MISGIRISRFRGIREGFIEGLKQVAILLGRNNAGKSSILEALYLVSSCATTLDAVRGVEKLDYVVSRRGSRGSWRGSRRLLWYMGDTDKPIEIEIIDDRGRIHKFLVVDAAGEYKPVRLLLSDGRLVELEEGYSSRSIREISYISERLTIGGELAVIKDFLNGFLFVDSTLIKRPEAVEKYAWQRVVARRLDKLVVDMIKGEFEPEAEGLTYIPSDEGYYLALQTSRTTVRVDDVGDGVRVALLTAMLTLAYKPTVLLVEEPELHMHPGGLYTLMKFLVKLAREQGFQIIASTHSLELTVFVEALSREYGVESSIIFVERENDVLKARSFSIDDVEALRKLGIDPRLLYRYGV